MAAAQVPTGLRLLVIDDDPAARNIKFVQAEKVENTGDLKAAAELFRQVGEDAEAYEAALVRLSVGFGDDLPAARASAKTARRRARSLI